MRFDDDEDVVGDEIVRTFVITGGRTRSEQELSLETMVEPAAGPEVTEQALDANAQQEMRAIVRSLTEPASIAEIAASLSLPLLSTQVLVSDLVSGGVLRSFESVTELDFDALASMRVAISAL